MRRCADDELYGVVSDDDAEEEEKWDHPAEEEADTHWLAPLPPPPPCALHPRVGTGGCSCEAEHHGSSGLFTLFRKGFRCVVCPCPVVLAVAQGPILLPPRAGSSCP